MNDFQVNNARDTKFCGHVTNEVSCYVNDVIYFITFLNL